MDFSSYRGRRRELINQQTKTKALPLPLATSLHRLQFFNQEFGTFWLVLHSETSVRRYPLRESPWKFLESHAFGAKKSEVEDTLPTALGDKTTDVEVGESVTGSRHHWLQVFPAHLHCVRKGTAIRTPSFLPPNLRLQKSKEQKGRPHFFFLEFSHHLN